MKDLNLNTFLLVTHRSLVTSLFHLIAVAKMRFIFPDEYIKYVRCHNYQKVIITFSVPIQNMLKTLEFGLSDSVLPKLKLNPPLSEASLLSSPLPNIEKKLPPPSDSPRSPKNESGFPGLFGLSPKFSLPKLKDILPPAKIIAFSKFTSENP